MSSFVDKASSKISKLSTEEITRILNSQKNEITNLNSVFDSLGDGLVVVDKDYRILIFNKFAQYIIPMFEVNKSNIKGSLVSKIINDKEIVSYIKLCVENNKNDEELFYEIQTSMFGNLKIRITSTVVRDINSVLFRFSDVTFLAKIRDEFKKNESLAAMTTMAAQVAHEIKNPLASISIYLQLLQKQIEKNGSINQKQAQPSIDVISEEIERLNKIAVDFLFAVKPMKVECEMASVNDVIKKTISVVNPELDSSGICVELNLATSLPKLFIDKNLVQQSILNLVRNSMQAIMAKETNKTNKTNKANKAKQGAGIIKIHSFMEENNVKVQVIDNGCGMTEEQLGKIFEPYYTTKTSGTGLGLTTIFKIMKELDGEILVSSEKGNGSTFTLSFPVPNSERFKIGQV